MLILKTEMQCVYFAIGFNFPSARRMKVKRKSGKYIFSNPDIIYSLCVPIRFRLLSKIAKKTAITSVIFLCQSVRPSFRLSVFPPAWNTSGSTRRIFMNLYAVLEAFSEIHWETEVSLIFRNNRGL